MALNFNILSSFDDKGLKKAGLATESFAQKASNFGKKAAAAFAIAAAAAAAFAIKLGVDAVKAAAEDEKAQLALAQQLRNTANATDEQIASVEDYIKQASLATGVTDSKLRPAFQRLVTATGDVAQAQYLTNLAMDIAGGTGKSLESVTTALSKAMIGQTTALTRLGVPLDQNAVKSKDLNAIVQQLAETYGGQAAVAADTFQGKLARLQVAFDEGLETVGGYLIDGLTPLVTWIVNSVIPAIERFANWLGPKLTPIVQWLGNFWQNTMIPALRFMAEVLQRYVIPAIAQTYNYVKDKLAVGFQNLRKYVEDNREEMIQSAKLIGGILFAAFKLLLWVVEKAADGFVWYTEALNRAAKVSKQLTPILQDLYNKLKLVLQGFAFFNPLAGWAVDGLEAMERGIKDIMNIDLSFAGENTAKSWLQGWGVGWNNNAPSDFFGDFKLESEKVFNVDIPAAVSSGAKKASDKLSEYKDKLKSKLQELKDEFKKFRDEVRSSIIDAIDFGAAFQEVEDAKKEAAENGEEFGGSFLDALIAQAEKAKEFAAKIQTLIEMGLSKDAITQVLAAGATAGTQIADELIAGGADAINKTNELVDSTKKAANKVAKFAADSYYGSGVETAKKMVQGFKDLIKEGGKGFKELMAEMDKLAKKLARTIKLNVSVSSSGVNLSTNPSTTSSTSSSAAPASINITVNGALDPESVARQIETILKRSRLRAGAY